MNEWGDVVDLFHVSALSPCLSVFRAVDGTWCRTLVLEARPTCVGIPLLGGGAVGCSVTGKNEGEGGGKILSNKRQKDLRLGLQGPPPLLGKA